jgi:hypothetical protein
MSDCIYDFTQCSALTYQKDLPTDVVFTFETIEPIPQPIDLTGVVAVATVFDKVTSKVVANLPTTVYANTVAIGPITWLRKPKANAHGWRLTLDTHVYLRGKVTINAY